MNSAPSLRLLIPLPELTLKPDVVTAHDGDPVALTASPKLSSLATKPPLESLTLILFVASILIVVEPLVTVIVGAVKETVAAQVPPVILSAVMVLAFSADIVA